jgi:exodeoxyribonuclease VII small subunit
MVQKKTPKTDEVAAMSFEQALDELNKVVLRIEDGRVPLQDSIDQYERGMALIRHCRTILQAAEKRIELISAEKKDSAPDAKPAPEPAENNDKSDDKNDDDPAGLF